MTYFLDIDKEKEKEMAAKLSKEELLDLWRRLLTTFYFEEKIREEARKSGSLIEGVGLTGHGLHAVSVGIGFALREGDLYARSHRSAGVLIGRFTLEELFCQYFGRYGGITSPRQGILTFSDFERGDIGFRIHHMGEMSMSLNGALEYVLRRNEHADIVGVSFAGDGATSAGTWAEAMNRAAINRLPHLFVIENNQHAISTRLREQCDPASLHLRGLGYDMRVEKIFPASDVLIVYEIARDMIEETRKTRRPALLECVAYRGAGSDGSVVGHNLTEPTMYMDLDEFDEWRAREPVRLLHDNLLSRKRLRLNAEELSVVETEVKRDVARAYEYACGAPKPKPTIIDLGSPLLPLKIVKSILPSSPACLTRKMSYREAIRNAIIMAMERDGRITMQGEDIAGKRGGVWGVTAGLEERFGRERVRNTPLAEPQIIAALIGEAMAGGRPIGEIQFEGFVTKACTQLLDDAGTYVYNTQRSLPMVIRSPYGYVPSSGHFHSIPRDGIFFQESGLITVCPATPSEAKGLFLTAALKEENPVIFRESLWMYSQKIVEDVPEGEYYLPLGKASVYQHGDEVTVILWDPLMLYDVAIPASTQLFSEDGVRMEIVSLRTLRPFDLETILTSVRKTKRAIILYQNPLTGAPGAEFAALISEHCFNDLKTPVRRLASRDTPVPHARVLEEFRRPKREDLIALVKAMLVEKRKGEPHEITIDCAK